MEDHSSDEGSNTYSGVLGKRARNDISTDQLHSKAINSNESSEDLDGDEDGPDRRTRR